MVPVPVRIFPSRYVECPSSASFSPINETVREPLDKLDPDHGDFDEWEIVMYVLGLAFSIEGNKLSLSNPACMLTFMEIFTRCDDYQYSYTQMLTVALGRQACRARFVEDLRVLERRFPVL